jgi:23S rRNA (cytidine1920-2'-O)/16S rRNA (cytidine1409-2'-O)-methyltransferase
MTRLDQALVDRGLCESREKAKRAILAGTVRVNQQRAHKASDNVRPQDEVVLDVPEKYVSRGGLKMEHALKYFQVKTSGTVAIDLGASTGGFTDCLLQGGAHKVYAVDVGNGQLAWKLRQDPRVVVMEKTNARNLTVANFGEGFAPVDIITIDCSFISLRKIVPVAVDFLRPGGRIVALIKPQFEAGKKDVDAGEGVITDPAIHERVIKDFAEFIKQRKSLLWLGLTESPILGPAGNKEFLVLLEKTS